MYSSLRTRLWLTYVILVGVALSIIGTALVLYILRNPSESRLTIQRLRIITTIVTQRVGGLDNRSPEQLLTSAERIDQNFDVRVALFDRQGNLLIDSRDDSEEVLPSIDLLLSERRMAIPTFRDSNGKLWLYTLRALPGGDQLIISTPKPRRPVLWFLRDEFFSPFLQAGVIALILALVLAFWVARWVAAPLQRMAVAARELADGKYNQIPLEGPTEVRTLGQAFNEMSRRVQDSQQSQKDFVANVSHELKTPLTSIQGFAQAILDGTVTSGEELNQAANVIYSESDRMNRLVLDLLDLAKFDAGTVRFNFVSVNINELLCDVIKKMKPQAKNARVSLQESIPTIPAIIGDPDRLSQVMTNLIDNALKHTQPGGVVSMRAKHLGRNLEISISDTGPGIPAEDLSRVFERFYQIEKSRPGGSGRGVGLGLSIAREIIQAHQGSIYVRNNRDTGDFNIGCTFVVNLPVASTSRDLTSVGKVTAHPENRSSKK